MITQPHGIKQPSKWIQVYSITTTGNKCTKEFRLLRSTVYGLSIHRGIHKTWKYHKSCLSYWKSLLVVWQNWEGPKATRKKHPTTQKPQLNSEQIIQNQISCDFSNVSKITHLKHFQKLLKSKNLNASESKAFHHIHTSWPYRCPPTK